MTSIVLIIRRINVNQFKCNYLKNDNLFNFWRHFGNLYQSLNFLEIKVSLIAYVLPKLLTLEEAVT